MACISITQDGLKFKADPGDMVANIIANVLNGTDEQAIEFMKQIGADWPILAGTGFTTIMEIASTYGVPNQYLRSILSSSGITKNDCRRQLVKLSNRDKVTYYLQQMVEHGSLKHFSICFGDSCEAKATYHHICMIGNDGKKTMVTITNSPSSTFNLYSPRVFLATAALLWTPGRFYMGNDFSRKVFELLRDSKKYGYTITIKKTETTGEPAEPQQEPDIKVILADIVKDALRDVLAELLPEARPEPVKTDSDKPIDKTLLDLDPAEAKGVGGKRGIRYTSMPKNFDRISKQYLNGAISGTHGAKLCGMSYGTFVKYANQTNRAH